VFAQTQAVSGSRSLPDDGGPPSLQPGRFAFSPGPSPHVLADLPAGGPGTVRLIDDVPGQVRAILGWLP
jgi:hypothetical protein